MLERWRGGGGRTRTAASIQQYSHAFNIGFWRALVPPFFLPSPLTRDCKAAPLCERVPWERVVWVDQERCSKQKTQQNQQQQQQQQRVEPGFL